MGDIQKTSRAISGRVIKLMIYLLIVVAVIFFSQKSFQLGREVFSDHGMEPAPGRYMLVTILPDDSAGDIADKMLEVNLIADKFVFQIQSICFELDVNEENAGTYHFNTSQSAEEMIEQIAIGDYNLDEDLSTNGISE